MGTQKRRSGQHADDVTPDPVEQHNQVMVRLPNTLLEPFGMPIPPPPRPAGQMNESRDEVSQSRSL